MRLPFLRPKPTAEDPPAKPKGRKPLAAVDESVDVEAARTQARRRLVGALVLLVIGVVGFPVLFETQPRPLPVNTPIQVVGRETPAMSGAVRDSLPERPLPATPPPADAGIEAPPASSPAVPASAPLMAAARTPTAASSPASAPTKAAVAAPASTARPASAAAAAVKTAASAPALPAKTAAAPAPASAAASRPAQAATAASSPASAAANGRFVVQAGAYTEAGKLREARAKIEQLGLKTYTQVIETDKGSRTRVRVGPFGTKAEADAVAAKIKRSGLPAAIVAL